MTETQHTKRESKREKQPISVPFIWEEKPGMPKKDWKPFSRRAEPPTPPAKFVVSVPFEWEAKPGMPLPSFIQPRIEPEVVAAAGEHSGFLLPHPTGNGCIDKQEDDEVEESPAKFIVSVPFEWEAKPGTPLPSFIQPPREPEVVAAAREHSGFLLPHPAGYGCNDKQEDGEVEESSAKYPAPPAKFIVSVPFEWEMKPGTPFPYFIGHSKEPMVGSEEHTDFLLPHQKYSATGYGGKDEQGHNEAEEISDSELDTYSVETDDSFTSAKSLLANGLIPTAAISSAVPVKQTSLALVTTDSGVLQSPGSPAWETDSISSYATESTSMAGASFLEWLFPLLVPNSNGADKGRYLDNAPFQSADLQGSQVKRPPLLTLGELIAMSRRRSCQRKINKMQKQQSMDFMKRNAFGCCIFGTRNGINQLQLKWKRHLQLKLM